MDEGRNGGGEEVVDRSKRRGAHYSTAVATWRETEAADGGGFEHGWDEATVGEAVLAGVTSLEGER